ncbi:DUF2252 family protein [Lichenihabitans psoromatis]|uniref:DUF2252 family protein n=1 Tax=Lichenihabitans psoromatis TaxID=2528642 RepID=UPI001036B433|nr:DUF2252 family protein [Lichenihabitans psoromatis]
MSAVLSAPKRLAKILPGIDDRQQLLLKQRNLKMAQSAHAYVRGATVRFYNWLSTSAGRALPQAPAVWIGGDCHLGNLGPVANAKGKIRIQIRDLDQTVIGNPAHDLIRLGLSLATAARGSDLPGVTTARMMEEMIIGYQRTLASDADVLRAGHAGRAIRQILGRATSRRWKHLAEERLDHVKPTIPLGRRFWPLSDQERDDIAALVQTEDVRLLVTALHGRASDVAIEVLDAAYWMKGCSSLGRLRYAVLLGLERSETAGKSYCLLDIKEAVESAAPRAPGAAMPLDDAFRVVEGARHLSPYLGDRMLATRLFGKPVVLRELMPQDMKLEIEHLSQDDAAKAARFLAAVLGYAHGRQMDEETKRAWHDELGRHHSGTLDAPSWLWTSVVDLVAHHEAGYLDHCRRYATAQA